jgi:hypothetical protein
MKVNSTCAVVKIVPGLAAGASAALRLPAGARYSSIAGPVSKDTDKQVNCPLLLPRNWRASCVVIYTSNPMCACKQMQRVLAKGVLHR